jgi:hypothetical protein
MRWLNETPVQSAYGDFKLCGPLGFPLQRAEPPDRFPRGLGPIADAAHQEQMRFLVWFEPERVAAGTEIALREFDAAIEDRPGSLLIEYKKVSA